MRDGRSEPYIHQFYGVEAGTRIITDIHGRKLELHRRKPGPADVVRLLGDGDKVIHEFRFDGVNYHELEREEDGSVYRDTFLDPLTGDIVVLDYRYDLVTIYMNESDGAVTAVVCCEGKLAFTESVTSEGIVKRCEYDDQLQLASSGVYTESGDSSTIAEYSTVPSGNAKRALVRGVSSARQESEWTFLSERALKSLNVHLQSGLTTELSRNDQTKFLQGQMRQGSDVVADVALDNDYVMLVRPRNNPAGRKREVLHTQWNTPGFKPAAPLFENLTYDQLTGSVCRSDNNGNRVMQWFSQRREVHEADGTVMWNRRTGEKSCISPQGDVVTMFPDGTSEFMQLDASGAASAIEIHMHEQSKTLPVPEEVQTFMRTHRRFIDPRDFLQMYCRYESNPDLVATVLHQLNRLLMIPLSGGDERIGLVAGNLLHHVAYPDEIFAGLSPTHVACAIQTFFAGTNPLRYISLVGECLASNQLRVPGGIVIPMDVENLLSSDCSGRDPAGRAFQTVALRVARFPDCLYSNSRGGWGVDAASERGYTPLSSALSPEQVTSVIFRLGGGGTSIVELKSLSELVSAFKIAGQRGMLVSVNANAAPFDHNDDVEPQAQLVNVSRITFEDRRVQVHLCSQSLRANAESSQRTIIDGDVLFNNMLSLSPTDGRALVIVSGGEHSHRYVVSAGTFVKLR